MKSSPSGAEVLADGVEMVAESAAAESHISPIRISVSFEAACSATFLEGPCPIPWFKPLTETTTS